VPRPLRGRAVSVGIRSTSRHLSEAPSSPPERYATRLDRDIKHTRLFNDPACHAIALEPHTDIPDVIVGELVVADPEFGRAHPPAHHSLGKPESTGVRDAVRPIESYERLFSFTVGLR
jgi:hypothetical protein